MAHTSGPWATKTGMVFANNCNYSPERGAGVCSVYIDSGDDQEGFANANLIAAAPDLLSNLQFAADLLTPIAGHTAQLARMRAVIAKARGES